MWNFKMLLQSTPTPTQRAPPCQAHHISDDAMRKFCFVVNLPPDLTRWYLTLHIAVTRDILVNISHQTSQSVSPIVASCKDLSPKSANFTFYIILILTCISIIPDIEQS